MKPGVSTGSCNGILSERFARGSSGVLTAVRGKLKRIFCLEDGHIVFAASNLIEEQLGEYLAHRGLLTPAARASAEEACAREGKKLTQVLLERWIVPDDELRAAVESRVAELLSSCLEWPDGEFVFASGRPKLDGEMIVRLSPAKLLLEHAKRFPANLDAVRVRIGPPDFRPVVLDEADLLDDETDLDEAARYLLEASNGATEIGDLLSGSPAGEDATLRALYGLVLVGALGRGTQSAGASRGTKEPPLGREECLAVLRRIDSPDLYGVLGLSRATASDQLRSAYYALARRYHPDRFRSGPLGDLLPKFETYFTRVTEAYNTLSNRSLREEYDEQLATQSPEQEADRTQTPYLARQNYLRGKALLERNRRTEAVTFFENAVKLDPSQAEYHLELGTLLSRNPRRRAEAERYLIGAAEREPTSTAAYLALGRLYQRAGLAADAARMFRETLRWESEHAEAQKLLAQVGDTPDGEVGGLRCVLGD